jgi:hypothetical protein
LCSSCAGKSGARRRQNSQVSAPGKPQSIHALPAPAIIAPLKYPENSIMEAEHINSISNKLDDLAQRAAELRRYL